MRTSTHTKIDQETLESYHWRPALLTDAPAIHALLVACDLHDKTENGPTLESVERDLKDTWLGNLQTDTYMALTARGQVVAFGLVFHDPEPLEQRRAFLWIEAHPEHRGCGLQSELLTWAQIRAAAILERLDSVLPGVVRIGSNDNLQDRIALCESHGFRPGRHFYRMRRDLRQPLPERPTPQGLTLRTYTPDLNRSLMAASNEAFQDHWNFEPVNAEDWDTWMTGGEDFRPDLTYLLMDGQEIAGFSINGVNPEQNARTGINEGWVHQLGTRRPWRKRGVASALLSASMQAFREEGLDYITLGVDTQNLTGALSLYQGLGFTAVKRFISFEKSLEEIEASIQANRLTNSSHLRRFAQTLS